MRAAGAMAFVLAAFVQPALADAPRLSLPIACEIGKDCWVQQYPDRDPSPTAKDYACGAQSYDGHDGVDIRIRDTAQSADVVAAAAGTVRAVRDEVEDRLMRSAADQKAIAGIECGNGVVISHGADWETQYCHLKKGSVAVAAGDAVTTGQRIGAVGYSGMAAFPHVHMAVRKDGKAIDPFRPDATGCGELSDPLWTEQARAVLAYRRGDIIRTGFAHGAVAIEALEEGTLPDEAPAASWDAMVAYGWAINLEKGDELTISLAGPGGVMASNAIAFDRPKAHHMLFAGKKRPKGGWPRGSYEGRFEVRGNGILRLSRDWQVRLD